MNLPGVMLLFLALAVSIVSPQVGLAVLVVWTCYSLVLGVRAAVAAIHNLTSANDQQ